MEVRSRTELPNPVQYGRTYTRAILSGVFCAMGSPVLACLGAASDGGDGQTDTDHETEATDASMGTGYASAAPVSSGISSSPTSGDETSEGSTDTGGHDGGPGCEDFDGDGFGAGADCIGPDCDDDNASNWDACFYISPTGNDANSGTADDPWLTFAHAISRIQPGDSLIVEDGTYTPQTTGLPEIDCTENAPNGTADAIISIRANHERRASLESDGSIWAFLIRNCSHWSVSGLRGRSRDAAGMVGGAPRDVFRVVNSRNIRLRRLVSSRANRYFENHAYAIVDSRDVVAEECEAYYFYREAFRVHKSNGVVLRRCYANSRGYQDLPDCVVGSSDPEIPRCSIYPGGGDAAFMFYESSHSIAENCISEFKTAGFQVIGGTTFDGLPGGSDNQILGSISLADFYGAHLRQSGTGSDQGSSDNLFENFVVIDAVTIGLYLRSGTRTTIRNASIFGTKGAYGLLANQYSVAACASADLECSFSAENVLAWDNAGSGIYSASQDDWNVVDSNASDNATDYYPAEAVADEEGYIRNSMSVVPSGLGFDACMVYVPETSNMKGADADGDDIGANILYRSEGGVLTSIPLWDPESGAFACGATVPELSDIAGASCFDVHERLNVNSQACPLPEDYAPIRG